jgi:Ribonuclease G/E
MREKLLVIWPRRRWWRASLDEESTAVAELEEFIGKTIRFQADEQYAQEQYDVVLL